MPTLKTKILRRRELAKARATALRDKPWSSGHHHRNKAYRKLAEQARALLKRNRDSAEAAAFARLECPEIPPELLAEPGAKRFFLAILTTDPLYLNAHERAGCELVQAFFPAGFDFASLDAKTCENAICEAYSKASKASGRSDGALHLGWHSKWDFNSQCPCAMVIPGYAFESFSERRTLFAPSNYRRWKRRLRKPSPDCLAPLGPDHEALWHCGASSAALRKAAQAHGWPGSWAQTARSAAKALLDLGAVCSMRVPAFFAMRPECLESFEELQSALHSHPNLTSELWSLAQACSPAPACGRCAPGKSI